MAVLTADVIEDVSAGSLLAVLPVPVFLAGSLQRNLEDVHRRQLAFEQLIGDAIAIGIDIDAHDLDGLNAVVELHRAGVEFAHRGAAARAAERADDEILSDPFDLREVEVDAVM